MSTTSPTTWAGPRGWESRTVCILGGGVLGRRIGACFLAAGNNVIIRDPSEKARTEAVEYIRDNIGVYTTLTHRQAGKLSAEEDLKAAVKDSWLVIEAVPEVLSLKESTFADLEKYAPEDCILGTNSSSYKSGELVSKVKDETKARILNMHFMMPPEAVIVELMTSGLTSPEIFPFVEARMKEAGLHPFTALKESTGFIFNRIWAAIKREVLSVLQEGVATPEMIDSIWIEQYASQKIGPCLMMDAVGLDTVEHIEQHYIKDRSLPSGHLDWLKSNYVDKGRLGFKSGAAGGLYPAPDASSQTHALVLNIGLAEPLKGRSLHEILHGGEILQLNLSSPIIRPVSLVKNLPCPDGIDVATINGTRHMFWTNMGNPSKPDGSIQSALLDGTDIKYLVEPGNTALHTPKQMVIDSENQKLYACDREGLRIVRCNLDGSHFEVIYQSGDYQTEPEKAADATLWPVGIAVSTKHNVFFWTQKGRPKSSEGRIFSASLDSPADAANRSDIKLVMSGLPECIDLEFDDDTGFLYWTDRGELPLGNTLNKKQVVPGNPVPADEKPLGRQIIAQGLGEGIGLRLDRATQKLYVTDLGGHLWKCSADGGLKEKLFEGQTHAYSGLVVYKGVAS